MPISVSITEVDDSATIVPKKSSDDAIVETKQNQQGGVEEDDDNASNNAITRKPWVPQNPITQKRVQEICVKHGYYRTPSCNDKLYLHHKGWDQIAGLEAYNEVKVLWLEGNCLQKVEGLHAMRKTLRSLYLHENMLTSLVGVNIFDDLDSLNVSDNHISTLQTLAEARDGEKTISDQEEGSDAPAVGASASATTTSFMTQEFNEEKEAEEAAAVKALSTNKSRTGRILESLNTLQAKNNNLKTAEAIQILSEFKLLSVLDLTGNKLDDGEGVLNVLEKMPCLKSLRLSGNPFVRGMSQYRRTVLSRCSSLMHLDDRPVFEDERRMVLAWMADGVEGEKAERKKMKQEEQDKIDQRLADFREMCAAAGASRKQIDGSGEGEEEDGEGGDSSGSSDSEADEAVSEVTTTAATSEKTGTLGDAIATSTIVDTNTAATTDNATKKSQYVDPALTSEDCNAGDGPVLVEREVSPPSKQGDDAEGDTNTAANQKPPNKYQQMWEMAKQVSDAKESDAAAAGQHEEEGSDDEGDAWTPE